MKNRSIRLLAVLALICMALIGLACAAQAEDDEKFEKEFRWFSSAAEPSVSNDEELDMGGSCTVTIKVKNLSTRGEGSVMLEVFEEATTETVLSTDPIFAGEEQEYQVPMKKGMYHLYIYADASYLVTVSGEYTPQLSASKLVLVKGAQKTVKVSYTAGASAKWSTGDPDVATVNQSGVITGRGTGATDISCKVGKRTLRVKVFVAGLNEKKATLKAGASKTFKVNFAGGAKLKWSSSNKMVATVNSNGVVKAVGAGKATISVRLNGNSKLVLKATVKVTPKLSSSSVAIFKGKTATLKLTGGGNAKASWSSSNKKVATVNSKGVVKGVGTGTCTIICKVSGVTLKCKVTVWTKQSLYNKVKPVDGFFTRSSLGYDCIYVYFKNNTGLTVNRVDFKVYSFSASGRKIKAYNYYDYYNCWFSSRVKPGESYLGGWNLNGISNASYVTITITKFRLANGTTISIPKAKQRTYRMSR